MRCIFLTIVICSFVPLLLTDAFGQEAVRNLADDPRNSKYLSPGGIDSWVFDAQANEVVMVDVTTNEFDPVIGLVAAGENSETLLFSVDDEGSRSRFSYRIQEKGKYKIRVHGFEMKGGGNYQLTVRRFQSRPIEMKQIITGRFDRSGQANFYFTASPDTNFVIQTKGSRQNRYFGPKGDAISYHWGQIPVLLTKREGEHLIHMTGQRGVEYSVTIEPVVRSTIALGNTKELTTKDKSLNIWDIDAKPGEFRSITVTRSFDIAARLIYAPTEQKKQLDLNDEESRFPELTWLPVSSKGDLTRYVVVFGRKGRYQLQTYSHASHDIKLAMTDPTQPLAFGDSHARKIPVGGTDFYGFEAKAGDLIVSELDSTDFDCVLRLFDERGILIAENDDSRDSKNSQIQHMVTRNGAYRWQVASLGNGGGGDYVVSSNQIELKQLEVGSVQSGSIFSGGTEYWSMIGEKNQEIYINVRSGDFNPIVKIYGPDGGVVADDDSGGIGKNSLLAVRLPESGRFTVWVSSHRDGGEYDIRILDAGWAR